MSLSLDEFHTLTETFRNKRILVVGDTIVDVNTYCRVLGISAETPTMVLEKIPTDAVRMHYDEISLGGAALVVRNLLALGAGVDFITYCGGGREKHHVETFQGPKHTTHCVYAQMSSRKPTTVKNRYWADGYKMIQVDTRDDREIDVQTESQALTTFNDLLRWPKKHDAIVVADYRHGFITEKMAKIFVRGLQDIPVYVASQVSQREGNHQWYGSANTRFVVNAKETKYAVQTDHKDLVITNGDKGACNHRSRCEAIPITPVDTCGAGDAFMAAYALTNSLEFANLWAGLSCTVKGPNPPTLEMAGNYLKDREN